MSGQLAEEDRTTWRRRFTAEANDRAWTLAEKAELTDEEGTELLYAAYAAAHHRSQVGTGQQIAQAELLLGRVHALLGHGDLAMRFARAAFDSITSRDSEPWELAFAHAILADAAAASGDPRLHRTHYARAKTLGESLTDPQDQNLFLATFTRIAVPP